MIRILWTFQVPPAREAEFAQVYGPAGDWARLFVQAKGYRGTKLLREPAGPRRYLTEDSWESAEDFDRFTAAYRLQYDALDARCQALTTDECIVGIFQDLD
jgi:heme-degrading monooxygenase HmoA